MEILALIFFVALALWLLTARRRRDARYRQLARDGVAVDAEITRRFSGRHPKTRQRRYYLAYRFETRPGHVFERQVNVKRAEYEQVASGHRIKVRYLPEDPGMNHTTAHLRAMGYLS